MGQFLIIDYGRVVFRSSDKQAAEVFMANRKRGVLCSVIEACIFEFLDLPDVKKPVRKQRVL